MVRDAYSDAQHDLDTVLTRPTLFDPADPATADFLRQGYFHRAETLMSGLITLPDALRAEILEAVRRPSRVDGPVGEPGGTWV